MCELKYRNHCDRSRVGVAMKRRQVLLSDDGRKLKRIQKEKHQKGVSVRSIAIQHVVSVRLHNKKQHVYLWLKSVMRQWTWTVLQQ